MNVHGWLPVAVLYAVALLGSVLHCTLPDPPYSWRDDLPNLYFVPVVIAAIRFGARPAVGLALGAGAIHVIVSFHACGDSWIQISIEAGLFVAVALSAAKLARMHDAAADNALPAPAGPGGEPLATAFRGLRSGCEVPRFSQIVAGLIHRFQTPVSSIEGAVWLLEDARVPQEKREEFVRIIRKESHQLDRALSDILYFTQPRKPRFRDVDLSALLDRVIHLAGPKEHGPFFLFQKNIPSGLPHLRGDPEQLRAMFLNLAMNAIQSMPGGGQITISARREGSGVCIRITDRGRGIPVEIIERIFEPFFTTRESGLGLGLTVARSIATAHGGTIAVNHNFNSGTTMMVILPLDPADTHEHRPHSGS